MIVRSGIDDDPEVGKVSPADGGGGQEIQEVGLDERTLHDYEVKLAGEVHADADPEKGGSQPESERD